MRNKLKRRAIETQESPVQLINHIQAEASAAAKMEFPTRHTMAKVVNRVRKTVASAPALPKHRKFIRLPVQYATYEPDAGQSESFVIADSGYKIRNRILIFGRDSTRSWLQHVDKIYCDGTFSLAPKLFRQVFAILGERAGFVFPLCHALLPDKKARTYARMISLLRDAWPELNPKQISLDFEIGLIKEFKNAFPDAEIQGCFFHLVKNMKSKLSDLGLIKRYNTEANFSLAARQVPAIAFVPPASVDEAISVLAPELPEELMPLLNYFEDHYVGRLRHAPGRDISRSPALFPIETWSVYQRTLNGEARTNNFAEAAHRKLQREFGVDHPSLWKFIDGL